MGKARAYAIETGPRNHRSGWITSRADLWLTAVFLALFFVQLAHHNLWRDELNAFGLARASPSLAALFHALHYEAHPWLWYVLLWLVSRVTSSALALKVVAAVLVVGSYLLLGLRSPFSRREKALLFSSYFISFEYAVLSRMYALLLLLLLLYLWQRSSHPERAARLGLLLGLMSSTDTLGSILSIALLVEYAASLPQREKTVRHPSKRGIVAGLAIYGAMTGLALWSARPARDISWRTTGHPFTHMYSGTHLLVSVLDSAVMPFLPVGFGPLAPSFWNPVAGQNLYVYLAALPLVAFLYHRCFRRNAPLLLLAGTALLLSIAFGHLVYQGAMRHWGVTFLAFLSGLWLLRSAGQPLPRAAWALLAVNALCGVDAALAQWRRPFSNAQPAAAWLRANHLENAPIAGTPDTTVASLAVLLRRPVYMLDCGCADTFVLFADRRDVFDLSQVPDRLATAVRDLGSPELLFIDAVPLTEEQLAAFRARHLTLDRLAAFTGATFAGEDFYIYAVRPPPAASR